MSRTGKGKSIPPGATEVPVIVPGTVQSKQQESEIGGKVTYIHIVGINVIRHFPALVCKLRKLNSAVVIYVGKRLQQAPHVRNNLMSSFKRRVF